VLPLTYASSPKALIRGARTLLVVAPAKMLTKRRFPKVLDKKRTDLLLDLVKDTRPGRRGAVASTLAQTPRWLSVGVLPDTLSRYNSPARADCIRHVVSKSDVAGGGKLAILVVLDDPSHALAAVNAIGRALPLFRQTNTV
jgi:probable aminopeptidase NPEPL1